MMNSVLQTVGSLAYRLGVVVPQPSDVPDHRLVELVEGSELTPGRALDLGSGTGRNALYLAGHGWEAVGVEMAGYAVEVARRKASEQGVAA